MDRVAIKARSGAVRRPWLMVACAAALLVGGITIPSRPAGADAVSVTATLTFQTVQGATVTCELSVYDSVFAPNSEVSASQASRDHSTGNNTLPCRGYHNIYVYFRDSDGHEVVAQSGGFDRFTEDIQLFGVDRVTRVEHSVFFDSCDGDAGSSCTLQITTHPK